MFRQVSTRSGVGIVTFVLTVVAFTLAAMHFKSEVENREAFLILLIVGGFFIAERLTTLIQDFLSDRAREETRKYVDAQFDEARKNVTALLSGTATYDVVVFPTNVHAIKYLTSRIANAIEVRNALLRYGEGTVEGPSSEIYKEWMKQKARAIKNGTQWQEIVSKHIKFSSLSKEIAEEYLHNPQYEYVMIDDVQFPMMQVTMVDYDNEGAEVLFGFHYLGRRTGPVFLSRKKAMIDYFQNYFSQNYNRLKNAGPASPGQDSSVVTASDSAPSLQP